MSDTIAAGRAAARLWERVNAILGRPAGAGEGPGEHLDLTAEQANREVLFGVLEPGADLDFVLAALPKSTEKAMGMVRAAVEEGASPAGTLEAVLGQHVAFGLLIAAELAKQDDDEGVKA